MCWFPHYGRYLFYKHASYLFAVFSKCLPYVCACTHTLSLLSGSGAWRTHNSRWKVYINLAVKVEYVGSPRQVVGCYIVLLKAGETNRLGVQRDVRLSLQWLQALSLTAVRLSQSSSLFGCKGYCRKIVSLQLEGPSHWHWLKANHWEQCLVTAGLCCLGTTGAQLTLETWRDFKKT